MGSMYVCSCKMLVNHKIACFSHIYLTKRCSRSHFSMALHVLLQQQEYCPPINPALIHMLFPDYAPNDVGLLKSTLEGMKKDDALAEQVTEFDAREAQARRTTTRFQRILSPESSV
jgi:hypothetical protein